jgi:hypothetical protein
VFYSAYVHIAKAGIYTFTLESDGPALMRVHEAVVIDADTSQANALPSGSIHLAAGLHPLSIAYTRSNKPAHLQLMWASDGQPATPIPASAWSSNVQ